MRRSWRCRLFESWRVSTSYTYITRPSLLAHLSASATFPTKERTTSNPTWTSISVSAGNAQIQGLAVLGQGSGRGAPSLIKKSLWARSVQPGAPDDVGPSSHLTALG